MMLGEEACVAEWAAGRELSSDQTIIYALADTNEL
jgi:hypothetical protein